MLHLKTGDGVARNKKKITNGETLKREDWRLSVRLKIEVEYKEMSKV